MRMPFLVAAVDRDLRAHGAPARGEPLVVGLSGGADSVALTDALASLQRRHGFRLVAAHLDHGLRPDSAADAAFCHAFCASLGIPFRGGTAPVRERASREKGGLEQAARLERYSFLRRVKRDEGAAWIAVAHTQDDQAETLLLRLLRGAGASGLAAMRPRSADLARPLLGVPRARVLEHLRARGLAWREDPSNADPVHLRNRVRHELLPYLEQRFNPRLREALARTAALLADDAAYVEAQAAELVARIGSREGTALVLDRVRLAEAPVAVARAAVRLGAAADGRPRRDRSPSRRPRARRWRARRPRPARRLQFPGGREARFTHRRLRLEKRALPATKAVSSSRTRAMRDRSPVLYTEERIARRVAELGEEITKAFAGREICVLGLMKGSLVFMADLIRKIPLDLTVHLVRVTSHREQARGSVQTEIVYSTAVPLEGRDVLLVDDIVDTGHHPQLPARPHPRARAEEPARLRAHRQARGAQDRRPPRLDGVPRARAARRPLPGGLRARLDGALPGAALHRDDPPTRTRRPAAGVS